MPILTDESVPRLLDDRYWLEATIGHGGMGVVYRAVDRTMARPVAVKVVRTSDGAPMDEEMVGRFLREAKNTARLHHENIVEVFDMGRTAEGDLYLVMELLEGESLSVRLRRGERLDKNAAVHIARQICAALHVAHAAGIVHRDLKPANVMLVRRGEDAHFVKVLDFGVAKSYAPDQTTKLTRSGMLVGTIEYMAPEQILGRRVDARTDIYSLGIVLYKMLTGKAPFRDGGVPSLIHAHLHVTPPPPSSLDPSIPPVLDAVTMRCIQKRPQDRFPTMGDLSDALTAAMHGDGLPSLAYDEEDPYARGDSTRVRSPDELRGMLQDGPTEATVRQGRVKVTRSADGPSLDARRGEGRFGTDAPRMATDEKPTGLASDKAKSTGSERPRGIDDDTTTRVKREDSPVRGLTGETETKPLGPGDRPRRTDPPRECAMCGTINSPFAIACAGCGISLAAMDQEAVRVRKAAMGSTSPIRTTERSIPRAPSLGGPGMHPSMSPISREIPVRSAEVPRAGTASPRTSVWQRILVWTGLRGR